MTDIEKVKEIANELDMSKDTRGYADALFEIANNLSSLFTPEKDGDVADIKKEFEKQSWYWESGTVDGDGDAVWQFFLPHIKPTADTKRDVIMDGREAAKALEIMIRKKAIAEAVKRHIHLDNCLICQWAKDNGVNPEQYLLESERGKE